MSSVALFVSVGHHAKQCDTTYEQLMELARAYKATGQMGVFDSDSYLNVDHNEWTAFWRHFAILTNSAYDPGDENAVPFRCAC